MSPGKTTVIKLGGSLLDQPDVFPRLQRLLSQMPGRRFLVIPGGGAAANVIRDLDRRLQLSPSDAHWQAIAAMSGNAELISRLNRTLTVVSNRDQADAARQRGTLPVLDAGRYLRSGAWTGGSETAAPVPPLPESWSVTSDSIAAFVAITWPADRLLLVKSCECEPACVEKAAESGRVDSHLPAILRSNPWLEVFWVNFRNEGQEPYRLNCVRRD